MAHTYSFYENEAQQSARDLLQALRAPSSGELEVSGEVLQSKNATVVTVFARGLGQRIDVSGESYRRSSDKFDPMVGYELAYGRALEALGRKFQKRAWARVAQADNDREQRRQARLRKQGQ